MIFYSKFLMTLALFRCVAPALSPILLLDFFPFFEIFFYLEGFPALFQILKRLIEELPASSIVLKIRLEELIDNVPDLKEKEVFHQWWKLNKKTGQGACLKKFLYIATSATTGNSPTNKKNGWNNTKPPTICSSNASVENATLTAPSENKLKTNYSYPNPAYPIRWLLVKNVPTFLVTNRVSLGEYCTRPCETRRVKIARHR